MKILDYVKYIQIYSENTKRECNTVLSKIERKSFIRLNSARFI